MKDDECFYFHVVKSSEIASVLNMEPTVCKIGVTKSKLPFWASIIAGFFLYFYFSQLSLLRSKYLWKIFLCFICQIPFLSLIFSLLICWVQNRLKTCFSCLAGKQFSMGIFIYCLELTCGVLALAKCPQDNVMTLSLSPLDSSLGSSVLPILASSQLFPVPCVSWLPAELGQLEARQTPGGWEEGRNQCISPPLFLR